MSFSFNFHRDKPAVLPVEVNRFHSICLGWRLYHFLTIFGKIIGQKDWHIFCVFLRIHFVFIFPIFKLAEDLNVLAFVRVSNRMRPEHAILNNSRLSLFSFFLVQTIFYFMIEIRQFYKQLYWEISLEVCSSWSHHQH